MNFQVKTKKQDSAFGHANILTINPYTCLIREQRHREEAKISLIINFLLFRKTPSTKAALEHVVNLVKYLSTVNINKRERERELVS